MQGVTRLQITNNQGDCAEACGRCSMSVVVDAVDETRAKNPTTPFGDDRIEVDQQDIERVSPRSGWAGSRPALTRPSVDTSDVAEGECRVDSVSERASRNASASDPIQASTVSPSSPD